MQGCLDRYCTHTHTHTAEHLIMLTLNCYEPIDRFTIKLSIIGERQGDKLGVYKLGHRQQDSHTQASPVGTFPHLHTHTKQNVQVVRTRLDGGHDGLGLVRRQSVWPLGAGGRDQQAPCEALRRAHAEALHAPDHHRCATKLHARQLYLPFGILAHTCGTEARKCQGKLSSVAFV